MAGELSCSVSMRLCHTTDTTTSRQTAVFPYSPSPFWWRLMCRLLPWGKPTTANKQLIFTGPWTPALLKRSQVTQEGRFRTSPSPFSNRLHRDLASGRLKLKETQTSATIPDGCSPVLLKPAPTLQASGRM